MYFHYFFLISCTHYLCKYNIWHKKIFNIFIIISFKNQCVGANKCLRSWLQFRSLTSVALKNSQEKQLLLKSAAIQAYWLICWETETRLRYLIQVYMCLYQWSQIKISISRQQAKCLYINHAWLYKWLIDIDVKYWTCNFNLAVIMFMT